MLCTIASTTLWLSKVLDGGRTVFETFQLDRTADELKKRNASVGRAVDWGGSSSLLDLIDFTPFGPYGFDL